MNEKFFKQISTTTISSDPTIPNKENINIIWYCEKKMILLLRKENTSEQDFEELCLLLNTFDLSLYSYKELWLSLVDMNSSYDLFKTKEKEFKQFLSHSLSLRAHSDFTFKTAEGVQIPLQQQDIDILHEKIKQLMKKIHAEKGYFEVSDLTVIKQHNDEGKRQFPETYFVTDKAYSEVEQDYGVGKMMTVTSCERLQFLECEEDRKKLIKFIRKMRFLHEFNNQECIAKLENSLKKQLSTSKIKLYGMQLLEMPSCTIGQEIIQEQLDKLLLDMIPYNKPCDRERDPKKIEHLIKIGANVNAKDEYGGTALQNSLHPQIEILCRKLLDLGADVNLSTTCYTKTILNAAINNKLSTEIISLIIEKSSDETLFTTDSLRYSSLHRAIEYGADLIIIQQLIVRGLSLTAKTEQYGDTPLLCAVKRDRLDVVLILLKSECIDLTNHENKTPLMVALGKSYYSEEVKSIINALISAGANLEIFSQKESMKLLNNAKKLYPDEVKLILETLENHSNSAGFHC